MDLSAASCSSPAAAVPERSEHQQKDAPHRHPNTFHPKAGLMEGSMPLSGPPKNTGAGCCVRHHRIDMKTIGTSMAARPRGPQPASASARSRQLAQHQVTHIQQPQ